MKVLFAYPNTTHSLTMPLGIAYLSASLKTHGHTTGILDLTWTLTAKQILQQMRGWDILAISATTLEYQVTLEIAQMWRQHNTGPIILGGPKATTEPETVNRFLIDMVCRGESEDALLEWVSKYERTEKFPQNVKNFYPNSFRPLNEKLDSIPFPDRTIFDKRHIELDYPGTTFLTSRGCPFLCTMCINPYLQKLYGELGRYTRFRSIGNLFEEIAEVVGKYKVNRVFFVDDTFTINKTRLEEFCERYPKEIGIPFLIMGRCNTVTQNLIRKLKKAGCIYIGFGVESGNETIRNTILKRKMTDQQIINAFKWCGEEGIATASYNMIGIPFETRREIFETVKLNKRVKPDIIQTTILYPFPKTAIYEKARQNGLLMDNSKQENYYRQSIIKIRGMSSKQLYALETIIPLYVKLPRVLWPFIRILEFLLTKIHSLIFLVLVFQKKVLERQFWKKI